MENYPPAPKVPQEIIEGFKHYGITVEIWKYENEPNRIGYFEIVGDGWNTRINTLSGLYGYLSGFNRAMEEMTP